MGKLRTEVSITKIPEALAAMRREMARLLLATADRRWAEAPEQNVVEMAVRDALREVAAAFEAGVTPTAIVELKDGPRG